MTRDEIAKQLFDLYYFNRGHILGNITMGMGKTRAALQIASTDTSIYKLVLTHTVGSRDKTWPKEMAEINIYPAGLQIEYFGNVDNLHDNYGLIIVDECHLITENLFKFLVRHINSRRILFLTGTLPDEKEKQKWLYIFKPKMLHYTFEQALEDGNINNIEFHVIYVDLDETAVRYKVPMRKGIFTEKEAYFQQCVNVQNSEGKSKEMHINNRMWFIYKSDTKVKAAIYIRNHLISENKRHILFTTTKDIADRISKNVHYSGCKNSKLDEFQSYQINDLVSINQMKVGSNIEGLRYIISQQLNSKMEAFMQMSSRATRLSENKENSIVYIIVARDTVDVTWMRKATKGIPAELVKEYHLSKEKLNTVQWHIE